MLSRIAFNTGIMGTHIKCYMCDSPATSHEHVPPKCVFPERKDAAGRDFRSQLITVPSCDVHNSKKATDDEFLMVSLAGIIGNNSIGYRHRLTKVNRAIRNTSGRLLDAVYLKRKHYLVQLENNGFLEVIWGTPDYDRLECCFERIARGLFFHKFRTSFKGRLKVLLGYIRHDDKNSAAFSAFIKHRSEIELIGKEKVGNNPSVFFYQFSDRDKYGLFMVRMCFYEGVDIYVSFIPEDAVVPYNLAMGLIGRGVKTYITLEGKSYEFN
jgi:hypothetical protein